MMKINNRTIGFTLGLFVVMVFFTACYNGKRDRGYEFSPNMYGAIGYNADQPNTNFKDGKTAQNPVEGTTPIGWEKFPYENTPEGYQAAGLEMKNPLIENATTLAEGKLLYVNMCSHCHGVEGKGDGSIVAAGKFPPPPSYSTGTSSRGGAMKDLTDGKIYHTITYGLNLMGSHASQLSPEERWKIVMYVRTLQQLN